MPNTEFLTLQRAEVTTDEGVAPRRILRLQIGAGLTCAQDTSSSAVVATLSATGAGGAAADTVPLIASTEMVERSEGIVVLASTVHAAGDYTGSTSLKAVLASPTGSIVRTRLWDIVSGVYVSGSALTTDSTGPTIRTSSSLTLASQERVYELHMDIAGTGSDSDSGLCSFAALRST